MVVRVPGKDQVERGARERKFERRRPRHMYSLTEAPRCHGRVHVPPFCGYCSAGRTQKNSGENFPTTRTEVEDGASSEGKPLGEDLVVPWRSRCKGLRLELEFRPLELASSVDVLIQLLNEGVCHGSVGRGP